MKVLEDSKPQLTPAEVLLSSERTESMQIMVARTSHTQLCVPAAAAES